MTTAPRSRDHSPLTRAQVAHAAFALAVLVAIAGLIIWFFSVMD